MGHVDFSAHRSREAGVLDIADHTNHGDPRVIWKNRPEALPEWVLTGPELPGQRVVDDGDWLCPFRVGGSEKAAFQQPDPQRWKIVRRHMLDEVHLGHAFVALDRDTFNQERRVVGAPLRQSPAHRRGPAYGRNSAQSLEQPFVERPTHRHRRRSAVRER